MSRDLDFAQSEALQFHYVIIIFLIAQSEGFTIWNGGDADVGKLIFDMDNSVWVDQPKVLHCKLRKEKDRLRGHKKPHECIPCMFLYVVGQF